MQNTLIPMHLYIYVSPNHLTCPYIYSFAQVLPPPPDFISTIVMTEEERLRRTVVRKSEFAYCCNCIA